MEYITQNDSDSMNRELKKKKKKTTLTTQVENKFFLKKKLDSNCEAQKKKSVKQLQKKKSKTCRSGPHYQS